MKYRFKCESVKQYGERSEAVLSLAEKGSKEVHSSKMRIMLNTKKEDNFFEVGDRYYLSFEKEEE